MSSILFLPGNVKKPVLLFFLTAILSGSVNSQVTGIFTINNQTGQDAIINSDSTSVNYGGYNLNQATCWTSSGSFFIIRDLLDFDISSIPANSYIVDAHLELSFATNGYSGGAQTGQNACYLQRITQAWTDTLVSWDNQPSVSSVHQVNIPATTSPTQSYTINVTQLVQDMVDDPSNSFGFMLRLQGETAYKSVSFASGDHQDSLLHPKLTITYSHCILPIATFNLNIAINLVSFFSNAPNAVSWNWDFGDGTYSTLQNPSHLYQNTGSYLVCQTVTDTCGTASYCDSIHVCILPQGDFTWAQNGLTVEYFDQSTYGTEWYWYFGDGGTSTVANPIHTYQNYGDYTVYQYVINECGYDLTIKVLDVIVGMNDIQHEAGYQISPNPAQAEVFLLPVNSGKHLVEILLPDGRLVDSFEQSLPAGQQFSIATNHLSKGIYFFRISTQKNIHVDKILIQ